MSAVAARSILLVKLRAIGDTVLTLPSVEALRRGFPDARLDVMVPAASAELLRFDPRVDNVLPYDRRWFKSLRHHWAVYAGLQRRGYDLAVCLHASYRTALIGWMSGAPLRSVRNHSGPDWFCNLRAAERKEPKSIIQRDFDALRALGLDPRDETPRLALAPWAVAEAAAFWRGAKLPARGVVALAPSAGKMEKRWELGRFHQLARHLAKAKRRVLWVAAPGEDLGLPSDLEKGAAVARFTSLQTLSAALKRAGALVGNDSSPRHLAAAVGARTLTLFGPEAVREWHPYRPEDGHWAVQPASGDMRDLGVVEVQTKVREWLEA